MSQLEKLKALQESKSKTANLTLFSNVVVIDVGIKPSQHFPKLKDDLGNKIKDENGKDKRSDVSDGYTSLSLNLQLGKWLKLLFQKIENLSSWDLIRSWALATTLSQQI